MQGYGMPVALIPRGRRGLPLSLNRSVPSISGMYERHDDPREDTTSTPADYIMDSYTVRGPCERPFLNRGIVHFHKKPVYGAKNAAAIMVSSSMLIRPGQNGTLYPATSQ